MIAMDKRLGAVVVSRKTKHTYSESKGTQDHIKVNACVSIWLYHATTSNFFPKFYLSGPYAQDGPDGALYSVFDNGYVESKLFYSSIYKLFIPHTIHIPGP